MDRPELTFDGVGINGPDEYRTRLATFTGSSLHRGLPDGRSLADYYGPMFAAAPDMIKALIMAEDVLSRIAHDGAVKALPVIRNVIQRAKEG